MAAVLVPWSRAISCRALSTLLTSYTAYDMHCTSQMCFLRFSRLEMVPQTLSEWLFHFPAVRILASSYNTTPRDLPHFTTL